MSTMTGSLPGLPPHSGLILYRMDVDEYESLAGAGVLKDPRVELDRRILGAKDDQDTPQSRSGCEIG